MIFVLYESGCRPGELLKLRIRDVSFDRYGAKVHVNGRTGERLIRLVEVCPTLGCGFQCIQKRTTPIVGYGPAGKGPFRPHGVEREFGKVR